VSGEIKLDQKPFVVVVLGNAIACPHISRRTHEEGEQGNAGGRIGCGLGQRFRAPPPEGVDMGCEYGAVWTERVADSVAKFVRRFAGASDLGGKDLE
jgi:hypothetical protein